jgi:AraC family transcriptional regulator, chitin signaling transcriptional activator
MKKLFFLFMFLNFLSSAWSQSLKMELYQVEQGLPTNFTKAVAQDRHGYLWIGTDVGIIKFDGKKFFHYRKSLPNNYVKSFYELNNGQLLVVHDGGVSKVVHAYDSVWFEDFIKGDLVFSDSTVSYPKVIFEDKDQAIWVSEGQSVSRYYRGKLKRYMFPPNCKTENFLASFVFAQDEEGTLWVASQTGKLFYFDAFTDKFHEVAIPYEGSLFVLKYMGGGKFWIAGNEKGILRVTIDKNKKVVESQEVIAIPNLVRIKDYKDNVFLAGSWSDGLFRLKEKGGRYEVEMLNRLPNSDITDLFINNNKEVWISTDEGVAFLKPEYFSKIALGGAKSYIQSLAKGDNGKVYTTDGFRVYEIEMVGDDPEVKVVYDGNVNEIIGLDYAHNTLWFGTYDNLLYQIKDGQIKKTSLKYFGMTIFNVFVSSNNQVWICQYDSKTVKKLTEKGEVIQYGKDQGITSQIFVLKESRNGRVFCGGYGEGDYLFVYDAGKDKFENISLPLGFPVGSDFIINDMAFDGQGVLWLASNYGLLRYDHKSITKIPVRNEQDHSEIELIRSICLTNDGSIWLGTEIGVIKYANEEFALLDDLGGLGGKTVSYRSIVSEGGNRLWVGTSRGLAFAHIDHPLLATPKPFFTRLNLNGEPYLAKGDSVITLFNDSYLQADFLSLSFPGNQVMYQYRLLGQNDNWSVPSKSTSITIPKISKGDYVLEMRALQIGGNLWSEPLTLRFKVINSWYKTWWAFTLYIVVSGVFLSLISMRLYNYSLVREKRRLEILVNERTEEITFQKEEIEQQKSEIEQQKSEILSKNASLLKAKEIIERQNSSLKEINSQLELKIEERTSELRNAIKELLEVNKELDTFVYKASHDLRGPIARMMGLCSLTLANVNDDFTKEYVGKINITAMEMNTVLIRLLELINIKNKELSIEKFDLKKLMLDIVAKHKLSEDEICFNIPEGFELSSDKSLVSLILRNLIDNAIKFSFLPDNQYLGINVRPVDNGLIQIEIVDKGVGVPSTFQDDIFEMFFVGNDRGKGVGLGLYEVKVAVKKLKGYAKLNKDVSEYTIFCIELPNL